MKATSAVLTTPWIASPRSSRWLATLIALLCATAMIAVVHGLHGRDLLIVGGVCWGAAIGCWCLLVAGNAMFVARDATALCVPSLRRVANASIVVHAVLFVLLPALLLGVLVGHPLFWLVTFSLAASVCMLLLLLPAGVLVALFLGSGVILNVLHPQRPSAQVMLEIALLATPLLAASTAWLWLRLQRTESPTALGFNVPLIWSLRLQGLYGFGARGANPDKVLARATGSWLAPEPNLSGLGPAQPVRSLRVAFGRNLMPQTWVSLVRQSGLSLGLIFVFSVLPLAAQAGSHDFRVFMAALFLPHPGAFAAPIIIACVIATLAFAVFPAPLRARWSAGSAELPLLALLPGLGDPPAARRYVLCAALRQTAGVAAVEFVILCAMAAWAGVLAGAIVPIALCVVGTATLATACILGALAARPLAWPALVLLGGALLLAVGLAMACAFAGGSLAAQAAGPVGAALAALLVVTVALCWRGWRAFERRPHPFLVGSP